MTMNATERARRSDSLYYDTQVTNRRALCDMIAHLESDLAESKAENAKLWELVDELYPLADYGAMDASTRAKVVAERARLRREAGHGQRA